MRETTITAQELENVIGYQKNDTTLSRKLLAHQIHEYDGVEIPKANKVENHPKIDISWNNLTDEDYRRIAMAKAQGMEDEFLSTIK